MKKEDIILKKDDKVYYKFSSGLEDYLIVDDYAGYTIKQFEEEDCSGGCKITKIERPNYVTIYETTENNNTHRSDETLQQTEVRHFVENLKTFIDLIKLINKE